jgi:hypothetical protein
MRWLERRRREHDDELLSAYIDGQLLGRARQEFEARLAREPELRARLEATRRMLGLVRSLPPVPAPRNFLLDPAKYGRPAHVRQAARWYPTLRLATTLATALLILVFAADLILSQALTPTFRAAAPAAAPQVATAGQGARQKTDAVEATVPPTPAEFSAPAPTAHPMLAAQPTPPSGEADQLPSAAAGEQAPEGALAVTPAPATRLGPAAAGAATDGLETGQPLTSGPTEPAPTPTAEAPAATPMPAEVGQAPPQAPLPAPGEPSQESAPAYTPEGPPQAPLPPSLLRAIEIGLAVLVILLVGATILAWRAT